MATPLTDSINALTTYANEVTGASDTTLSDAVYTLASGYGQGGGSVVSGTYTPSEDTLGPSIDIGVDASGVSHFLIIATSTPFGVASKKVFGLGYTEFGQKDVFSITSNNSGGASTVRVYQDSWWSKSGTKITCTNAGANNAGNAGYFVAALTYKWYAW